MRTPFHLARRSERGASFVTVALFMIALFGFAALSLDVANTFLEQRKENIAADSASLAAATLLTNDVQNVASITTEARVLALTNGLTDAEIAAGNGGAIEVGSWNSTTFTAGATVDGRYNAVRVPARRNVPMNFAKVVGFPAMNPAVESVAMITGANEVTGSIPFGLGASLLVGKGFDSTNNTIVLSGSQNSGSWGKLDLCGINMSSNPNTTYYIANGVPCTISLGESSAGAGAAGLKQAFDPIVGQIRIFPIVDAFGNGNSGGTITGFVLAKVISSTGNGQNWSLTIELVPGLIGNGGGGPGGAPYAQSRVLVK